MKISDVNVRHILGALNDLRYGSVLLTIHDSRIVQIERTEKERLPKGTSFLRRDQGEKRK